METLYNARGEQIIPFVLNFSTDLIKSNIWYHSFRLVGDRNSIRFIPPFVRLIIVYGKKHFKVDTYKEYINLERKKEIITIPRDGKIIFSDKDSYFIWYNDKKYYINNKIVSKPYKPDYLFEILDNNNINFKESKFYYESLVDVLQTEPDTQYEKVKIDWPFLTKDEFKIAKAISLNDIDNNWYQTYIRNNFNYKLEGFWKDYYQIKSDNKEYFINQDIIQTQIVISKGDENNNYISLENIFKYFEANENIPFISVKISGSTRIKLYSGFKDYSKIKDWTLTDSSKKSEISELTIENSKLIEPKGLNFKIKQNKDTYATVTLYANGRMTIRCFKSKDNYNLKFECPLLVKRLIKIINDIPEAFLHEPRKIKTEEEHVSFFNIDLIYKSYFDTEDFLNLNINYSFVREYLFSDLFYELSSDNFVSLVYKTIIEKAESNGIPKGNGYFSFEKVYNDFKLMIKRSTSFENSSLIQILGINSYSQLETIKFWMNLCFNLAKKENQEQVVERINKNKEIKNSEIFFDPRKCQGERQPSIFKLDVPEDKWKSKVKKDSYDLVYKNHRFICESDKYPYPGFTVSDDICCFTKDQRKNAKFLRNVSPETNFLIQPINLFYSNKKEKYLVVLKNGNYFFIQNDQLIPLPGKNIDNLIKKEKEANDYKRTYFSKEISYNDFLINLKSNNKININTNGSLTCSPETKITITYDSKIQCIDKDADIEPTFFKNNFEIISASQHIITTDKILPVKRLGTLPANLKTLFESLNLKDITIYRMGVVQGSDSFLQAVSINIGKTSQEISKEIDKKLTYNLFLSLENGELAFLFDKKLKNFKSFLQDTNQNKSYIHYWDLIQYIFNVKIIIFDYFEQTIISHQVNEKLDLGVKTIFVLKYENNYESIVAIDKSGIVKQITLDENSLISKFYDYVCNPNPKIELKDIKYQILDSATNKIKFLVLKDNFFLPINEISSKSRGPLPDIEIRSFSKRKPTGERMLELANKHRVEIEGQVLKDYKVLIGLLTKKMEVIPVRNSPIIQNLSIVDFNYYPDAEKSFSRKVKKDKRIEFIDSKKQIEIIYHFLKYRYSQEYIKEKLTIKQFFNKYVVWENSNDNNISCSKQCVIKVKDKDTFKDYFIQRLELEAVNNSKIKSGQISSKYEEIPENQIIFTEVSKVIEHLKSLSL